MKTKPTSENFATSIMVFNQLCLQRYRYCHQKHRGPNWRHFGHLQVLFVQISQPYLYEVLATKKPGTNAVTVGDESPKKQLYQP
jgi:hypothetical protein